MCSPSPGGSTGPGSSAETGSRSTWTSESKPSCRSSAPRPGRARFVPINPALRAHQVAHILEDSGARVLVTSAERLALLGPELAGCRSVEHVVIVGGGPEPPDDLPCTVNDWDEFKDTAAAPEPGLIDVDMAAILYTSGSTGQPKGVVLSHRNLIAGAESVSEYLGNHEGDTILAALPFSFDAGFSQLTTGFAVGAHVVLVNYLLPGDVVRLCAEHRVTGLTCVPPLWIQLAEQEWPPEATESMRYFATTGGRMPEATLAKLRADVPPVQAILDVWADRGLPLDVPRPGGGGPPPGLDRQGDPQRRDPRRSRGRVDLRPGRGGRARPSRRARRDGVLERPGAHRGAFQARAGKGRRASAPPRPRSSPATSSSATRTASCTSSAARTR